MTDSPRADLPGVIASFLDIYASDSKAGRSRALADYQALFPGFDDIVAEEWVRLESGDNGEADAVDTFPPALRDFGPYRIIRELGRGGQGFVYLAHDCRLNRPVALKILTATAAESEASRQRLLREAESASRLDHPGICAVYDAGEEGGLPYIAMRYVEGETLAKHIAAARGSHRSNPTKLESSTAIQRCSRTVADGVAITEKVARAIHAAHAAGIIHRDVKPGNIIIARANEPVVLDFGMARAEHEAAALTLTGQLVGTPADMAPEQLQSGRGVVDRRTDVYGLGVTLFECVTLRRPFEEATREQLYRKIMIGAPPNPRTLNPAVSEDLRAILEVALEKDPDRRYQTAEAFADDLRRLQNLEPIRARRAGAWVRSTRFARRRPALAALIAILLIGIPLVGVLAGYYLASLDDVETAAAVRRADQLETLLVEGFTSLHAGEVEAAARSFERALERDSSSQEAVGGLARTHLLADRPRDALAVLDARDADGEIRAGLLLIRASVLKRLGREADADAIRARWDDMEKDSLGYFQAGEEALDAVHRGTHGASDAALEWMTRAVLSRSHARRLYHTQWAHAAGHARDERTAAQAADALVCLWPDSASAWYWRGFALARIGKLEEAERALTQCIQREPDYVHAYRNLGLVRRRHGDLDGAIEAYRASLRVNPAQSLIHYSIARILSAKKDPAGAIEHLRKALEMKPLNTAYAELGLELLALERHAEAEAAFRQAIAEGATGYRSQYGLGRVLIKRRARTEALVHFLDAVKLKPSDPAAHCGAGYVLNRLGRPKEALAHLDIALANAGDDSVKTTVLFERGVALARLKQPARAIEILREVIERESNHAAAHVNLGVVLARTGAFDQAELHFRAALKFDPKLDEAHRGLGTIHVRNNELDLAVEHFRKAVELAPTCFDAQYHLATTLSQVGEHEDALVHLDLAASLKPNDPRPSFERSRLFGAQKRFKEAIEALRDTLALAPRFAEAHCNLGHYLKSQGQPLEALGYFRNGHGLGSSRGGRWRYPSQRWIDGCERTVLAQVIRDAQTEGHVEVARAREALRALLDGWRAAFGSESEPSKRLAAKLDRVTSDPILSTLLVPRNRAKPALSVEERAAWGALAASITELRSSLHAMPRAR